MCSTLSDVAIITVKDVNYCWVIHDISKSKAIFFFRKFFTWRSWVYIKCKSKKSMLKIDSTIIHARLMAWGNRNKQHKSNKKDLSKVLMPAKWHPTRWWNWQMSGDKKIGIEPIFTDKS